MENSMAVRVCEPLVACGFTDGESGCKNESNGEREKGRYAALQKADGFYVFPDGEGEENEEGAGKENGNHAN